MNNVSMKFRSRSGTKRKTSLRTAFYFMTFIDDLEICSRSSALSFTVQMRQFYGPVSYSILSSCSNFSFFSATIGILASFRKQSRAGLEIKGLSLVFPPLGGVE